MCPKEHLAKAEAREKTIAAAKPIAERLKRIIEKDALLLFEEGKSREEIRQQLASTYDLVNRRRLTHAI